MTPDLMSGGQYKCGIKVPNNPSLGSLDQMICRLIHKCRYSRISSVHLRRIQRFGLFPPLMFNSEVIKLNNENNYNFYVETVSIYELWLAVLKEC